MSTATNPTAGGSRQSTHRRRLPELMSVIIDSPGEHPCNYYLFSRKGLPAFKCLRRRKNVFFVFVIVLVVLCKLAYMAGCRMAEAEAEVHNSGMFVLRRDSIKPQRILASDVESAVPIRPLERYYDHSVRNLTSLFFFSTSNYCF